MAKSFEKLRAVEMRRAGASVGKIAKALEVSKSSVSHWCEDIELTAGQRQALTYARIEAGHKGRLMGTEANKRKRIENISRQETIANQMVGHLTSRDKLMLGIALYWGEGMKARGSNMGIVNSDPETVLFARDWFEQLGVERSRFRPYIFISEIHRSRAKTILSFWSRYLHIPKQQFANIVFLKGRPKKIYANHNSYYGVLALRVRKGMDLKYRILGLIKSCKQQAGVAQLVRAVVS